MTTNAAAITGFLIFAVLLQCVSAQNNTNSTLVDNTTSCDPFATRTTFNSTYDECTCQGDFQGNGTYCAVLAQVNCSSSEETDGFAYQVYLNQTYIDYYYDYRNLRLLNASCNNVTIDDGYYVLTSPSFEACGSNVTNTSDAIIYSNVVLSNGGGISSGDILQIPFQCIVTATLTIGMNDPNDTAIPINMGQVLGNSRIEFPVQQGTGVVTATMYLYQDSNYATVFNGVPVLTTTDMLYVKIALDTVLNGVYIISKQCWATPDEAGLSSERFDIIEPPGCLKSSVTNGALTSNGISEESRFQLQVFQFLPTTVVYLHCQVQLCTPSSPGSCQPSCSGSRRRRRRRDLGETKLMTSQLIIRVDGDLILPPDTPAANNTDGNTSDSESFEVTILLPVLLGLVLLLMLAIIGLFVWIYVRNRRGK